VVLADVLEAVQPHAHRLGSADELAAIERLAADPAWARQRGVARGHGLAGLVEALSDDFGVPTRQPLAY
jgi:hypothetical protein